MLSFLSVKQPGSFHRGSIPQWVTGITLEGHNHEYHPDGDFAQECHDLLVIKPNTWHHWKVPDDAATNWKCVYFVFMPSPSLLTLLQFDEIRPGFMKLPLAGSPILYKVRRMMLHGHYLLNSHWPNRVDLAMNALESALLWCRVETERLRQETDPRISAAVEYMNRHFAEKIYLEDIAKAVSLSVPRLMSLFASSMGMSPIAYLEKERLERARKMLIFSYFSIKEIAAMSGYPDPVYFCKRFVLHFKMSPLAYRKKHSADLARKAPSQNNHCICR